MIETQSKDFVMSRVFDAPRALLWQCFTDPERMKHWWGPKGFTVLAAEMDLRVGGSYHYGMKAPNGSTMWGLFKYREIVPQQKLVFIKTKFTVRWQTLDATAEEQKTFDAMHDSMTQGWTGTMDKLAAYLASAM